ncbi:hypothetical protein LMH87_004110 [Akanthomyces muscarius]|uniref:Uncharacterized protein n=1 Tax=Akanthomyces muscarius TaxID=2231603 RepID=A0A9W8Q3Z5_AKAMU|nr:hypothetical protein LMH87_004110 [Akanthomyces muscarius]KAJ4145255.1 hypothetical protein LMH87_004110 [Akanthomyces muscarius]
MLNRPNTDQLTRLIKLNTINALTANASILNLPVDWLVCNAMSPFGLVGPPPSPTTEEARPFAGPASLVPTVLQRRIPHRPWTNLFPLARMRNSWLPAIHVSSFLAEDEEVQLWTTWRPGLGCLGRSVGSA